MVSQLPLDVMQLFTPLSVVTMHLTWTVQPFTPEKRRKVPDGCSKSQNRIEM